MTEALAVPAQPAAPAAAAAGTAPPGLPPDAASAFLAALQASAAAKPPPGVATPSARTAPAEGAKAGGDSSEPDKKADPGTDPGTCQAPVQGLVALLGMAAPPIQVTAQPATGATDAGAVQTTAVKAPPGLRDPKPIAEGQTGPVPAPPRHAAQPVGGPTEELQLAPQQPVAGPTTTAPKSGTTPAIPAAPPEKGHQTAQPPATTQHSRPAHEVQATAAAQQQGHTTADGDPQQRDQSQDSAHSRVDAVPAAATRTDDTTVQSQTVQLAPTSTKPVAETAPAADRPVRLRELPEAVRTAVRVAVHEGRTDARLELHPHELGQVQIHLRYEAGGVTASVTAESRIAAAALTAQAPDLKRALESQGLTVLGLDVQQAGVGAETTPDRDRLGTFGQQGPGRSSDDDPDDTATTTIEVTSLPLADGQVDVLA